MEKSLLNSENETLETNSKSLADNWSFIIPATLAAIWICSATNSIYYYYTVYNIPVSTFLDPSMIYLVFAPFLIDLIFILCAGLASLYMIHLLLVKKIKIEIQEKVYHPVFIIGFGALFVLWLGFSVVQQQIVMVWFYTALITIVYLILSVYTLALINSYHGKSFSKVRDIIYLSLFACLFIISALQGVRSGLIKIQDKNSRENISFTYNNVNTNSSDTLLFIGMNDKYIFMFNLNHNRKDIFKIENADYIVIH